MPKWVIDLFVCWWTASSSQSAAVVLCGRGCPLVFYGVFGGKEMIGILKITRGWWRSLSLFSLVLFIFGCLNFSFGPKFSWFSYNFFFYLGVFSWILSVYLGAPYAFNDILITCNKNKIKLKIVPCLVEWGLGCGGVSIFLLFFLLKVCQLNISFFWIVGVICTG